MKRKSDSIFFQFLRKYDYVEADRGALPKGKGNHIQIKRRVAVCADQPAIFVGWSRRPDHLFAFFSSNYLSCLAIFCKSLPGFGRWFGIA